MPDLDLMAANAANSDTRTLVQSGGTKSARPFPARCAAVRAGTDETILNRRVEMHIIKCNIGHWRVEARMKDVDRGTRLAIFSAMAEHAGGTVESRHTVVFDHVQGCDQLEEAKAMMQRVLNRAH